MRVARNLLTALVGLMLGCVSNANQFSFPPDRPLEVVLLSGNGNPRSYQIEASDVRNVKLRTWLAANQVGWSIYPATPPGQGILVSGGELRLQFVGTSVLACQKKQACLQRNIKEAEYAFLKGKA